MSKSKFKKEMLEQALERIMHIREMIESFHAIRSYLTNRGRDSINCGTIHEELYRRELDEWQGLLMWGLICDNDTRDRLKAAAYDRFLADRMDVRKWMFGGDEPSSWLVAEEDEFRKNVRELFLSESKQ